MRYLVLVAVLVLVIGPTGLLAAETSQSDPAAHVAIDLAVRIGQPAVLGELVSGILLGNRSLLGWN